MQVAEVVVFSEEAGLAVVAALDDVQRDVVEVDAGAAGHDSMLTEHIEPGPFEFSQLKITAVSVLSGSLLTLAAVMLGGVPFSEVKAQEQTDPCMVVIDQGSVFIPQTNKAVKNGYEVKGFNSMPGMGSPIFHVIVCRR